LNDVLQHDLIERQVGDEPFQLRVFVPQLLQLPRLAGQHPAVLFLPAIERLLGHTDLATDIADGHAGGHLLQHRRDLLDGAGTVVSRFVYGTRVNVPEYLINDGTTYRIFSDHLGSPRLIVDATTGAVVHRMDFGPFGEVQQNTNPGWLPFGFAGGLYDLDTGLVRFGARDYDARTGRWTAKDPLLFGGLDVNVQTYVQNDPINTTDVTGLQPDQECGASQLRKCFEQNRLSSLFGDGKVSDAVEFLEIASLVSFSGDMVATAMKATRSGIGGGNQAYASGLNAIFRRIGRLAGKAAATGALVVVGDVLTPALATFGVFSGSYDATILVQCLLGGL
jgi:RHS repeat-associated protein